MNVPSLTQNQKLILSFLASTAAGAVSAVIAAVVQSYTQQGLNIPVLINVALIAFGAFFGPALYNFVPAHIQQVLSAAVDTSEMLRNNLQQLSQQHGALTQTVQVLSQTVQKQAVAPPVAPLQPINATQAPLQGASGVTQLNFSTNPNNWMLDKPTANTTAVQLTSLQGVQQVPFPPARPVPPQSIPAVRPQMETVNLANTPVDVSQQNTAYTPIPSDLHFGDSQLMPTVQ